RAEGRYVALDRPRHLSFTFAMPQFSPNHDEITVDLYQSGEFTLLNFTQSGPDIAEELRQLAPGAPSASEAGWQLMFDALEKAPWLASGEALR
ncbi:MAG: SRPBCC domain-containing protein, partial [Proteobacteria bacterium]